MHPTSNLEEVLTFIEVARHLSLSVAAKELRVSTATVSRRLSKLEEHLGVALLHRSTRGVALTEAGARYVELARRGLELIASAEEEVQELMHVPRGVLRVAAPTRLLQYSVGKIAVEYARLYPEVELHLLEYSHTVDMDEDNLDIAIQILPPSKWELQGMRSSRDLTRKAIVELPMVVCASPAYLERHGLIEHPHDLPSHRCIILGANLSARFVRFYDTSGDDIMVEVPVGIFTTSVSMCLRAAIEGVGPAGLTLHLAQEAIERGELVRVLSGYEMEPVRCVAVFVEGPRPPRRIRAFLDLLQKFFFDGFVRGT